MNEEEIKKQYANGIVNADEVIKNLIDKFKRDKTSVDIQQLQLMAEYLIYKVDKLQEKIIQISEICIDESKCHISTKDAIEKIRRII